MHGSLEGDAECVQGSGLEFHGSSHVDFEPVELGGPLTFSIWHYRNFDSGHYQRLFTMANLDNGSGCCPELQDHFIIRAYSPITPYQYLYPGSVRTGWYGSVSEERWYNIVVTSDNNIWTMYLDGNQSQNYTVRVRYLYRTIKVYVLITYLKKLQMGSEIPILVNSSPVLRHKNTCNLFILIIFEEWKSTRVFLPSLRR